MIPNVLSIAGSDPSGGAGIQADLKTFASLDVYGCGVVAALTAQNTQRVHGVLPVPHRFVTLQLEAVFTDIAVRAVKIGMLGEADVVSAVAAAIQAHRAQNVVVDPVLRATSGGRLLDSAGMDVMRRALFPLATVVTPNVMEAGALLGRSAPATVRQMRDIAGALRGLGSRWVLVTGGHVDAGGECVDVLYDGSVMRELRVPRVGGGDPHGTGCALSSAIAAFLARGYAVPEACAEAQRYVANAIAAGERLNVGIGRGTLHHVRPRASMPVGAFARDTVLEPQ